MSLQRLGYKKTVASVSLALVLINLLLGKAIAVL